MGCVIHSLLWDWIIPTKESCVVVAVVVGWLLGGCWGRANVSVAGVLGVGGVTHRFFEVVGVWCVWM